MTSGEKWKRFVRRGGGRGARITMGQMLKDDWNEKSGRGNEKIEVIGSAESGVCKWLE